MVNLSVTDRWLDKPVPALHGRTPLEAAASEGEDLLRLESLLRQFEYESVLAAADGHRGIDVAWLREELAMPVERPVERERPVPVVR